MSLSDAELIFKKHWKPQQQSMSKYAQLVSVIKTAVAERYLEPGNKLPTETDFVNGTPYSLGTVQRAMRILVDQGVIERRQGIGTFVSNSRGLIEDPQQCRAFNNEWNGFLDVFTKVLGRDEITDKGPWNRFLGDHLDSVMRIERILLISNEYKALSRFYFDPVRLPALRKIPIKSLNGANFRQLLDQEFGLAVRDYTHNLRVEVFDKNICRLLDIRMKSTGAIVEAIAYSEYLFPLYFQEIYIPPNTRTMLVSGTRRMPDGERSEFSI